MSKPSGFTFSDVVVDRGGRRALDGFSARIPTTGITAVFGSSGSGKSTLLRLCNRLEVATEGRVELDGVDVTTLDPLRLRRRAGMVLQRPTPFPGTVRDNLLAAEPDADAERLSRSLARAALDDSFLDRDATALSGGEAQRVCLARTLVTEPTVLLLDEPTSSLDEAAASILENAACDLATAGTAIVWVSHDPAQVSRVCDRVVRIEHGRYAGADIKHPPEMEKESEW